jgi:hypothetical protein
MLTTQASFFFLLEMKETALEILFVVYKEPAIKFCYETCFIWIPVFSLSVHTSENIFLLWSYLKPLKQHLVTLIPEFLFFTLQKIFLK